MENIWSAVSKKGSGPGKHIFLCIPAGILFYIFVNIYVKQFTHGNNEEISLAATIFFLGSVYTGRFLSQLWIPKSNKPPNAVLLLLPLIITACVFLCVQFASSLLSHRDFMYVLFLVLPFFIFSVASGMLIKLTRTRIKSQIQEARAAAANSQSELHLLQSQLSPHFLFNTLNNMYGISITQHEKIPALLLKLSDLLRYTVYDTRELFVLLKDELAYINNYIDFEKIRIGERLVLTTDMDDISAAGYKIAPMVLIVFVENAFKHSKNTHDQKIFIDIALKIWGDSVLFSVKNSHRALEAPNDTVGSNSGFGLSNVKQRLELLYPGEFDLQISGEEELYTVMLRIKIK